MKKHSHFLVLVTLLLCGSANSYAYIVGTDFLLQGRYSERGLMNNSVFGAYITISGYHYHFTGARIGSAITGVYDYTLALQNKDSRNRVLVSARGVGYSTADYIGLGTIDLRVRCCICNTLPISTATDFADDWAVIIMNASDGLGQNRNADIVIAVFYNIYCGFS